MLVSPPMFKYIFFIIFAFLKFNFVFGTELKSGDIILFSLNCYECRVIESETNSHFSHSGVVIKNIYQEVKIGQSLGQVGLYSLEQFLKNKTPGTQASVYRPKQFLHLSLAGQKKLDKKMITLFNIKFNGAPFDTQFSWDNFDHEGRELLYCSEFIAKFLDHFLVDPTVPYPLSYKKNADYWFNYFDRNIPEGVLGNSPSSFSRDSRFVFIGNL